jgi:adenine-specific DNA-methyltransferase
MTKSEPKKVDLKSKDIAEDQKQKLREAFPNVFNEDKVDFDRLRLALGEDVDAGAERYGMTWPGKAECMKVIQQPSIGTLKPAKKESVDFDTTENLFIEGDNLEVLKLLQNSYYGKIKMIYIDPPYNTGQEFIYPDKYSESLETYLAYTGQIDDEGKKFSTNTETDGRFHSRWINMMYPRLFLARNLLQDDGLIFISIDDNEVDNLKKICDEIFGAENSLGTLTWIRRTKPINSGDAKFQLQQKVEYVCVYCRNKNRPNTFAFELPILEERKYNHDGKYGKCRIKDIEDSDIGLKSRDTMKFPILGVRPGSGKRWKIGAEWAAKLIEKDRIRIIDGKVKIEIYPNEEEPFKYRPFWSHFDSDAVRSAEDGKADLNELLGAKIGFDTVKPISLIQTILDFLPKNLLILDFFSGSGTTAHAVLDLNNQDGGNRKIIMVQLPEPCSEDSEAFKAGYKTIADIGKERIRRAAKKIKDEYKENKKEDTLFVKKNQAERALDLGFKVFKLDKSNFKIWEGVIEKKKDSEDIKKQLEFHIDHVDPKATDDDILYELLLKSGFPLTTKVEEKIIAEKKVYLVEDGALFICLEKKLTKEVITKMARLEPARVVCLDQGFSGNDQLKTNAVQIMKSHGVNDFRTV